MLKQDRQKKIVNLIRAKPIGTQEALRAQLERVGVAATQSSVSRDLEELGIVKHHGRYSLPHANGDSTRGLLSLDVAGDVLVIAKCLPGRASAGSDVSNASFSARHARFNQERNLPAWSQSHPPFLGRPSSDYVLPQQT